MKKNISKTLTQKEYAKIAGNFQDISPNISNEYLAEMIFRSRQDPRFCEVICEYIRDYWFRHDADQLNQLLKKLPQNGAIFPILEQIKMYCIEYSSYKFEFIKWVESSQNDLEYPRKSERFFEWTDNSINHILDETPSHPSFSKYNFRCSDLLFNKGRTKKIRGSETDPIN